MIGAVPKGGIKGRNMSSLKHQQVFGAAQHRNKELNEKGGTLQAGEKIYPQSASFDCNQTEFFANCKLLPGFNQQPSETRKIKKAKSRTVKNGGIIGGEVLARVCCTLVSKTHQSSEGTG